MLLNLREYHRISPQEPQQAALDHALALLARRNIHTVPLAGGSSLVGSSDPAIEAVVDLQGLGLEAIRLEDGACISAPWPPERRWRRTRTPCRSTMV